MKPSTLSESAPQSSTAIEDIIRTRRSINFFKSEQPPRELIVEGIDLARWAPNHHLTEPWHFYLLSTETIAKVIEINTDIVSKARGTKAGAIKHKRWSTIPGWLVVTCERSDDPVRQQEDYAACCCAVHALSLFLWSRGVGVKWTTGDVTRDPRFYDAVWVDPERESVVALLWYGYPAEIPVTVRKPVEQILVDV